MGQENSSESFKQEKIDMNKSPRLFFFFVFFAFLSFFFALEEKHCCLHRKR